MIITSEVMFSVVAVALLVALSAGLHKNYQTIFHIIWMEDGSWLSIDAINFWCRFRNLKRKDRAFSNIFVNFSENDTWILTRKSGVFRWVVRISELKKMDCWALTEVYTLLDTFKMFF